MQGTLVFEVPLYHAMMPWLVLTACDAISDQAPRPCAGTHPLREAGRLTLFTQLPLANRLQATDTSRNKGSPLFGVMEPDTSVVPESIRPHALFATFWSVSGGVQLHAPSPVRLQWSAGGGFQRQTTPLSPEPL